MGISGQNTSEGRAYSEHHGLISYIDTKVKCGHLIKLKKGLCGRCLSVCPIPPPPVYVHVHISQREEGESWSREKGSGATYHKAGLKIPTWLNYVRDGYLQSINSDKHLRKLPLQVYFLDDDILHCLLWVLSFYGAHSAGQSKHRTDGQENCKIGIQECCIGYHREKEVAISIAFTTIYIWDWISLYLHISFS
jgi:hypothetical protein